jgi:hypothetical protein
MCSRHQPENGADSQPYPEDAEPVLDASVGPLWGGRDPEQVEVGESAT